MVNPWVGLGMAGGCEAVTLAAEPGLNSPTASAGAKAPASTKADRLYVPEDTAYSTAIHQHMQCKRMQQRADLPAVPIDAASAAVWCSFGVCAARFEKYCTALAQQPACREMHMYMQRICYVMPCYTRQRHLCNQQPTSEVMQSSWLAPAWLVPGCAVEADIGLVSAVDLAALHIPCRSGQFTRVRYHPDHIDYKTCLQARTGAWLRDSGFTSCTPKFPDSRCVMVARTRTPEKVDTTMLSTYRLAY